jgi:RNA polymerase sigma-70 factor (ECF subfamily)
VRASDEHLLELARLGDEPAFELLVERHRVALLAHCRAIVGDGAAQDALQQTLINAWRALLRGCGVRHPRAWLHAIAHRACLQLLRREAGPADELPETLAGDASPHEHLERRTRVRAALAAVASLPEAERDALLSTSVHGRSGRDTARHLGVSEERVRQLVFQARGRARSAAARLVPLLLGLRRGGASGQSSSPASLELVLAPTGALQPGAVLARIVSLLAMGAIATSPLMNIDRATRAAGPSVAASPRDGRAHPAPPAAQGARGSAIATRGRNLAVVRLSRRAHRRLGRAAVALPSLGALPARAGADQGSGRRAAPHDVQSSSTEDRAPQLSGVEQPAAPGGGSPPSLPAAPGASGSAQGAPEIQASGPSSGAGGQLTGATEQTRQRAEAQPTPSLPGSAGTGALTLPSP